MAGGKTNSLEDGWLNYYFRSAAGPAPANVYVALFTASPSDTGGGTEVTGGGYARVVTDRSGTNVPPYWNVAAGTGTSNNGAIAFPQATANWGLVKSFGLFPTSTAGTLQYYGPLVTGNFLTFTTTDSASSDTLESPAHGFAAGTIVRVFAVGGTLPGGLTEDTRYYVINSNPNNFQVSLTQGGAAVAITSDGAGQVAQDNSRDIQSGDTISFATGQINIVDD